LFGAGSVAEVLGSLPGPFKFLRMMGLGEGVTSVQGNGHLSSERETITKLEASIAARIASERRYHNAYYLKRPSPLQVSFDLADSQKRKPHNLTWAYYDTIRDHFQGSLLGKAILVVGCGLGDTALNLAKNGAHVDACDVSEVAIAICQKRAAAHHASQVNFFVSSLEELDRPATSYDAIVGEMILHHVDIPLAVEKIHRLLEPGGVGIFMEWKTYPILDKIRAFAPLKRLFPPGGITRYATEYERKLSKGDFAVIRSRFPQMRLGYRYCLRGKLSYFFPNISRHIEKLDYWLLRSIPLLKRFTDGVIIQVQKEASA
jgi:ubiquinone/menaquinone biosynthesis C-methylase UbiE